MSYLVSQLWLCLLLALLFGALIGWFLRGGCKTKLAAIRDDWEQRYTLLEDEKNSFSSKSHDGNRLDNERKNLLSRLTAMENGANIASSVLKENKDKLDETEQHLDTIKLELQQRDQEISELQKNSGDAAETLTLMLEKSSSDEEKSVEIQGLLDAKLSESKAIKLKLEQNLLDKNKETEALAKALKIAEEESKSDSNQIETLQALLDAHEDGSNALSEEHQKLAETLLDTEALHFKQKKKSIKLSSQLDLKEKEMKEANLALKAELEKLKNIVNFSQEEVSLLLKQSSCEEETKQTQGLLNDGAKDLESYKREVEKSESKLAEALNQKKSEIKKLTKILNTLKEETESKSADTESLQLLLDQQKVSNKIHYEKESELKKALSLSDKLNIDYEKKTTEFVSQLALKDEKIKKVESVLSDTKQQLNTIEPQVTHIKSLMKEYETSSKEMLVKLSTLESQSDTYRAKLLDAESKLKLTKEQLQHKEIENKDELANWRLKLQTSEDEVQQIKENLLNRESKITQYNKKIAKLKGRLDSKKTEVDHLTADLNSSQKKLKTSNERRKESALKLVGSSSASKKSIVPSSEYTIKKKIINPKEKVKSVAGTHKNPLFEKEILNSNSKAQSLISSVDTGNVEISTLGEEYEIETIEGIGRAYGKKLRNIHIFTTTDLLNKATLSAGVHDIANTLKEQSWVVRSWVSMSDLLRVDGVDGQYAELLEFSGIHSVQSLAKQTANPLSEKMFTVNEKEHHVKVAPKSSTVAEWIIYATTLTPRLIDNLESIQKKTVTKIPPEKSKSPQNHDIEEIDGIGKGYGRRLRAMGIHTTTKLLNKCTNTDYEKNIAKAMAVNEKMVSSWCQMADLIRVKGIDGQFADLLFFSGITSVKELSIKDASKLINKIESVNKAQQRMKETPTKEMVIAWITSAKLLC